MTERAIDKMVEYLDSSASIGATRSENIRIAKRLALEEAKEKPTAPASLVEELSKWVAENFDKVRDADGDYRKGMSTAYNAVYLKIDELLSRYRPSPQADIVGECPHNRIEKYRVEGDIGGRPWQVYICKKCGKKFDGELI